MIVTVNIKNNLRVTIYIVLILLASVVVGAAPFSIFLRFHIPLAMLMHIAGLLFIGWQHTRITRAQQFNLVSPVTHKGLLFTFLLSVLTVLLLSVCKNYGITNQQLIPLIGGAAFLLPPVIQMGYIAYQDIPDPQLKPWYKLNNLIDQKAFVFLSSITIQIKVQENVLSKSYSCIECIIPGHFELGKIFHYFLIQQQINHAVIQTEDDDGIPYAWNFYLERKWQPLIALDPEKSLQDHRIKANATIIAKRIVSTPDYSLEYMIKNNGYELHQ